MLFFSINIRSFILLNAGYKIPTLNKHPPKIKMLLLFVNVSLAVNMPKISTTEIGNESAKMDKAKLVLNVFSFAFSL